MARIRSSPPMPTGRLSPSSSVRATDETGTQARRSAGTDISAASLTTPIGYAGRA